MSGRRLLRALAQTIDELLAPGICLTCGAETSQADSLCEACGNRIPVVPNPCQYCGQPNPLAGIVCPACRLNPPRWQRLVAPLQYEGIARDFLLQLKHDQASHLARALCRHCRRAFSTRPQVLLPVPLHLSRLRERGYNQALDIARIWSADFDIPIDRHALRRARATRLQAGLGSRDRIDNLRQAFAYRPRRSYQHVAVVDDIVTSGATAAEITRVLHRAGVEFVEIWALARACRK